MAESYHKQHTISSMFGIGSFRRFTDTRGIVTTNETPLAPVSSSYLASADGVYNPRWKDQIRNNQNATTSFTGQDYILDESQHWFSAQTETTTIVGPTVADRVTEFRQNYGYTNNSAPGSISNPSGSVITSVDNRAKRKFLDAYERIHSSFEAGQDIGEYKQTLESVIHPMKSLKEGMIHYLSSLKKVKHKNRKSPKSLPKILSDTYLEFHFGWQPLADDVASLIADAGRYRFPQYPINATAADTYQGDIQSRSFGGGFGPSLTQKYKSTGTYFVRYKGVVRSNSDRSGVISQAQALRLTPRDWLPTAWDLLPYSWIADYFVNVGDILQGLAFCSADLVWGCYTTRIIKQVHYNGPTLDPFVPTVDTVSHSESVQGGSSTFVDRHVTRSTFAPVDLVPSLEFRVPLSKYPFLNMGALLLQRSRGVVPFY